MESNKSSMRDKLVVVVLKVDFCLCFLEMFLKFCVNFVSYDVIVLCGCRVFERFVYVVDMFRLLFFGY